MSDWVKLLTDYADKHGNNAAADAIGMSPGTVSQCINGVYPSDTKNVRVRIELVMGGCVDCPVLGTIGGDRCFVEQRRPLKATNPMRVQLWRACHRSGCTNAIDGIGGDHE